MEEPMSGGPVTLRAGSSAAGSVGVASVCRAPSASMYFDPRGKVRACCQSRGGYLGDVGTATLREIWDGAATAALRDALADGRFPSSCAFCAWQRDEGDDAVLFARTFDHLPEPTEEPRRWPTQMEFALTNTCNLQCVMCSGDYSSAIRSQREGRPPMAAAYGDAFFEQLVEFLPHLDEARFYGGEPLLGREPLRVLELLADLDPGPRTTITTNATIWSPRIERLLATLRPHLVVSLDGASAPVFERIRPGARFDEVIANVGRYRELVGPHRLSLTTCLMVENVHEFVELLNLSSAWQVDIGVNVLHHPLRHSLYARPPGELAEIVESLAARRHEVAEDRLATFDGHVSALVNRFETLVELPAGRSPTAGLPLASYLLLDEEATSRWGWLPFAEVDEVRPEADAEPDGVERDLGVALHRFELGTDGVVRVVGPDGGLPPALRGVGGRPVEDLQDALIDAFGAMEGWELVLDASHRDRREVRLGTTSGAALVITARRDAAGRLLGARYRLALDADAAGRLGGPAPWRP